MRGQLSLEALECPRVDMPATSTNAARARCETEVSVPDGDSFRRRRELGPVGAEPLPCRVHRSDRASRGDGEPPWRSFPLEFPDAIKHQGCSLVVNDRG